MSIEIIVDKSFFTLCIVDIKFIDKILICKTFITPKILFITWQIETINKKNLSRQL